MSTDQLKQRIAELERTVAHLKRQVARLEAETDTDELPIELTPQLKAEIERRLADAEANPHDQVPWEVLKAAALARFQKK